MRRAWLLPLLVGALAAGCGDTDDEPGDEPAGAGAELTVFAAASLTDAFEELATAFEEANPGAEVTLNLGPSSGLATSIIEGAPADVFASANAAQMDVVVEAGAAEGRPEVFVRNVLQIAVPSGNPAGVQGLADFADPAKLIGLCAEEVPCGELGARLLAREGITAEVDTFEPDVRALLGRIEAGELDAGLVYRSDVATAGDAVEGIAVAEAEDLPTDYPIVALADAAEPKLAQAFLDLVLSRVGAEVLAASGFLPLG